MLFNAVVMNLTISKFFQILSIICPKRSIPAVDYNKIINSYIFSHRNDECISTIIMATNSGRLAHIQDF